MLWLDAAFPLDKDASDPGVARGSCSSDSGKPDEVRSKNGDAAVSEWIEKCYTVTLLIPR
jgi:cellulose 1,4-beta-cellobiosidase